MVGWVICFLGELVGFGVTAHKCIGIVLFLWWKECQYVWINALKLFTYEKLC